jgi:1,4-alpha-glucan branching enzyme
MARAEEFVVATADDGTRNIRVLVPQARTVELMADFTDWAPVPLTRERGGMWGLNIFIAPGVHRVNVRVDGGEWQPPPGLTTVPDGFGGLVGLLVVQ